MQCWKYKCELSCSNEVDFFALVVKCLRRNQATDILLHMLESTFTGKNMAGSYGLHHMDKVRSISYLSEFHLSMKFTVLSDLLGIMSKPAILSWYIETPSEGSRFFKSETF